MRITLSVPALIAWTLAISGIVLITLTSFGVLPRPGVWFGLAVLFGAATAHIQHRLARAVEQMTERELAAYELGRLRGI